MILQELLCFKKWALAAVLPALVTLSIAVRAQVASASFGIPAGSIWTQVATPNPSPNNILESLSADSEQDIWAVGDFVSLRFDGTKWSSIPLAAPQGEATIDGDDLSRCRLGSGKHIGRRARSFANGDRAL